MMLSAEWISRTSRADQRPPTFIFFLRIFELLNMSGIYTTAPPHLDAHDKNSMYSYLY